MAASFKNRDGQATAEGPLDPAQLLRALTQITPECIKVVAGDGRLLQMNPAGLEMIEAESWESVECAAVLDLIAPESLRRWC